MHYGGGKWRCAVRGRREGGGELEREGGKEVDIKGEGGEERKEERRRDEEGLRGLLSIAELGIMYMSKLGGSPHMLDKFWGAEASDGMRPRGMMKRRKR